MPTIDITIAAGQWLSDVIAIPSKQPLALIAPDAWDPAVLTFLFSADNITFHEVSLWSTDQIFSIPVVPSYWTPLSAEVFPSATMYLKLRSGTKIEPVPQSATRTFILMTA